MKKTITITIELNEGYGFETEHSLVDALQDTKSAINSLLYGKMLWTGGESSRLPIKGYTITTD